MPGKDERAPVPDGRPAVGSGQSRGASAKDLLRGNDGASGRIKPLSGTGRAGESGAAAAHSEDRGGRTALGKQTLVGAVDQHDSGTRGRPFQLPAILRAPSSLLSHPLFLHTVPQLGAPFLAPSIPPFVPAPLLFAPPALPVLADSAAPQTQTPDVPQTTQPPAETVPSPKVELSVISSAIDTAPTSVENPSSSDTVASPDSASANTTSAPAPDISPIAFATGEPVSASLVDSSFTNARTADIPPATNTGGKVAAACVIGAVFLLLLNWAFWLVIRRRRRARRSLPAHWDFAAPVRAKGDMGRVSEDAFARSEDERVAERDVKGGMVTVPV